LKGFPGPYSSYVYRTIGFNGILKLMSDIPDRYAQFHSKVVYCAPDISLKCFQGVAEGKISNEAQGASGFGFDPIFQPLKGSTKTFGEMSAEEKSRFSHRAHALRVFAEWYRSYCRQSF